jgi:hypothetical protein
LQSSCSSLRISNPSLPFSSVLNCQQQLLPYWAKWQCYWVFCLISYVSWVLANIMTESSCCFWECNWNSGWRFWVAQILGWLLYTYMYTHCWDMIKSVGSHGSLSLLFMTKAMV